MTTPPLDPNRARLISGFGWRTIGGVKEYHAGIDLAAVSGEIVRAVRAGQVLVSAPSGQLRGYGNVIVVQHHSGEATLYAHLSRRDVQRGAYVNEGQQIGAVGDTGGTPEDPSHRVHPPHLHFELLRQWPPPAVKQGRLDPSRIWPPAVSGQQPRHPSSPGQLAPAQPRPGAGNGGRSGLDSAGALILVLALALASRR